MIDRIQADPEILQLVRKHYPAIAEPALQEEIARVGQIMEFKAGEVIMDYGAYIRLVPLIVKGSIKVVREDEDGENEIFLYFLNAGDTCSMSFSCCMMSKQSDIRTTAEDDTMLIAIPVKYVDEWMMRYTSWKNFIMSSYDQRLHELVRTIDNIVFRKLDERLLTYLEKKAEAIGSKTIHTTHQDIAYDMNASREAISRLLKQLEKMEQIKLGRNKIELV